MDTQWRRSFAPRLIFVWGPLITRCYRNTHELAIAAATTYFCGPTNRPPTNKQSQLKRHSQCISKLVTAFRGITQEVRLEHQQQYTTPLFYWGKITTSFQRKQIEPLCNTWIKQSHTKNICFLTPLSFAFWNVDAMLSSSRDILFNNKIDFMNMATWHGPHIYPNSSLLFYWFLLWAKWDHVFFWKKKVWAIQSTLNSWAPTFRLPPTLKDIRSSHD